MSSKSRRNRSAPKRRHRKARPRLELLESRQLLAASLSLDAGSGVLSVMGTSANDLVRVEYGETTTVVDGVTRATPDPSQIVARIQNDAGDPVVTNSFSAASIKSVKFSGQGGSDYFGNRTTKAATWTTTSKGIVSTSLVVGNPANNAPGAPIGSGIFLVGPSGKVTVDYSAPNNAGGGEVAIFSLRGMGGLKPGSPEFIREAARRALTESTEGHIVFSDSVDSARGGKAFKGIREFDMAPGDSFAVISVTRGALWNLYTGKTDPKTSVLFSLPGTSPGKGGSVTPVDSSNNRSWDVNLEGRKFRIGGVLSSEALASNAPIDLHVVAYSDLDANGVADPADPGRAGIQVTVKGVDFLGNAVERTVASAGDGCAEFVGIPAGIYRVTGVDSTGATLDGGSQVGGQGGTAADGAISGIVLLPGDLARGYALGRIPAAKIRGNVYGDGDRDRLFDAAESGIAGVVVRLTGKDDRGAIVDTTVKTAADGSYVFAGLRPGTYDVTESQPAGWFDGRESIGSFAGQAHAIARNGVASNDAFGGVTIRPGEDGRGYNFGEWASAAAGSGSKVEVNLRGTEKSDTVEIELGSKVHRVRINGAWKEIDATVSTIVTFDGLGGEDTVNIVGLPGSETMTIAPGLATLIATNLRLEVNGASSVYFKGGMGDRAYIHDTKGDDVYKASPTDRVLEGPGYRAWISGVERVYAHATAGGNDVAYLVGSAGDDGFKATPADARMSGSNYYNFTSGFDQVEGVAGVGGNDRAQLYDSAGDDEFSADPTLARLSGVGFESRARGFGRVDAFANAAGNDRAALAGSAGDDKFQANPLDAQLNGAGFDLRAFGFETVAGTGGKGGADKAYLTGTHADDTLDAAPGRARLTGPGLDVSAEAFSWILASGGSCLGTDSANLTDSSGNDILEVGPNTGRLTGPGFSIRFESFTNIKANSRAGGMDQASFKDSAWDDALEASPGRARLYGRGFDNAAIGFASIRLDGSAGGRDRAVLTDSLGDDALTALGSTLTLGDGIQSLELAGFESVSAQATKGKNRKKVDAIDFALELLGSWTS